MKQFILIRLLQLPLILAVIYLITFMLVWVAPGDPFKRTDKNVDPAVTQAIKQRLHADHWYRFLGYYPVQMLKGDFGPSLTYEAWPVGRIIRDALPISAALGLFAMMIAVVVGTAIGSLAAVRRGGPFDWLSLSIAMIGISLPSFVAASVLFALFSVPAHVGSSGHFAWLAAPLNGLLSLRSKIFVVGAWGSLRDLILPGFALSLAPMAYIARLTRASMIDVLGSDYIRTARAKGLSKSSVIWKHALRNAFLPAFSFLGPASAATLTGSFIIEKVFNIRGLGVHFVNSVLNRDQTLILGTVMVYSLFLLGLNLLVDIGYAFVDPRIDVTAKEKRA